MSPGALRWTVRVVAAVAAVGAYHLLVAPPAPGAERRTTTAPDALAQQDALVRRLDSVRADVHASRDEGLPPRLAATLSAVERRTAAAERAVARGRRAPSPVAAGTPPPPRPWTRERIEALDAVLDEIDSQELHAFEVARWPDLLEAMSPGLDPAAKRAATDLLADFYVKAKGAFRADAQGYDYDAEPRAVEAAIAARREVVEALRGVVPERLRQRLDADLPKFPVDPATRLRAPSGLPKRR